jgi:hypothetical protein
MKKLFILVIILALIYVGVKLSIKSPDEAIPSATEDTSTSGVNGTPTDTTNTTGNVEVGAPTVLIPASDIAVLFTGYGPGGKVENGSLKVKESTLTNTRGVFGGSVVFDMNTITSVPIKDTLIKHLKSSDFFDAAKYPTATFAITGATSTEIKGDLTMKGITQPVTLPVAHNATTGAYTSKIRINMELFGIKQTFTDKEFVLDITVK